MAGACLGAAGCGAGEGDAGAGNPESELSAAEATRPLRGAPSELVALRRQASEVIEADNEEFQRRLDELRGVPVVVNAWASWCGPCRFEFPFFQAQAIEHEERVAFLGLDVDDSTEAAQTFLRELPLPYPSYTDPDYEGMRSFDLGRYLPSTVFIGSDGTVSHTKLGPYESEDELAADIERYAR